MTPTPPWHWRGVRSAAAVIGVGCLLAAPAPAKAAPVLTRGPYLQLLTTNSVTVAWHTEAPAACSLEIEPIGGGATVVSGGSGIRCAIDVRGLDPGETYRYVPRGDGLALTSPSVFRTPGPGHPLSFLVFGDSGSGRLVQRLLGDVMAATPADFLLHTGDMAYPSGRPEDFDPKVFRPYAALLRRLVLWPCLGNHDVLTAGGAPWREAFFTPANNAAGTEDYYSFDYGDVHVVVLDSTNDTRPGSAQHAFLDQDLGASAARWKFVAFHHTPYSSRNSTLDVRANLVPLMDAHGVDVVFAGHAHSYERTRPLRSDAVVGPGEGTVYITTGGGGDSIGDVGTSPFTAHSESGLHFTRVAVHDGWLMAQMIRSDGAVRDTLVLEKGGVAPAPVCGDGFVNHAAERCDGDDHGACPAGCAADCTCLPVCGDGAVNQLGEACDGTADAACPGRCRTDCRCGAPAEFVEILPVADTYIEEGIQATWDHGAGAEVSVDTTPPRMAYLKFDLRGVTATIRAATLNVFCTNAAPHGGTVYPVRDSSWVEGDRNGADAGSTGGPGLTWADVDTNGDGQIGHQDTSPYVPDFAAPLADLGIVERNQAYAVDVTAAVQAGAGLYSLALENIAANGGAYASREHADPGRWPWLRLELGIGCTVDADCDDGLPCTRDACVGGVCQNPADDALCDDGDPCSGIERCIDGVCAAGTAVACDDGIDCTADACDRATGACAHAPHHDRCDDGVFCDGAERCDPRAGCTGAGPVVCPEDGVACTVAVCDEAARACVQVPDHTACDDGMGCDVGRCEPALGCVRPAMRCDDGNPCTADVCDEAARRCVHVAVDGACDDGDPCTFSDRCGGGTCRGAPSCGNGVVDAGCGETCDGSQDTACDVGCVPPGLARACTCIPRDRCGDGVVNRATEECDGGADEACRGRCRSDCTCPSVALVEADVTASSKNPGRNLGAEQDLTVDGKPAEETFLRIRVVGVHGREVTAARLRLRVARGKKAGSDTGGRVHAIGTCDWDENRITWRNRPPIDGPELDRSGRVGGGDVVEFDITDAIAGDGAACVALVSRSKDEVIYQSREARSGGPEVELHVRDAAPSVACGDGRASHPDEECDGPDDALCPGLCLADCLCDVPATTTTSSTIATSTSSTTSTTTTTRVPICGDGEVNRSAEECDGADDAACSGSCRWDCSCAPLGRVEADATVLRAVPESNFGGAPILLVDEESPAATYLRVRVDGVGPRRVVSARLRLRVPNLFSAGSDAGGRLRLLEDCDWAERRLTWWSRPAMSGLVADEVGRVSPGDDVYFDLTDAIFGDGVFCFGLEGRSTDGAVYYSREAPIARPELLILVGEGVGDEDRRGDDGDGDDDDDDDGDDDEDDDEDDDDEDDDDRDDDDDDDDRDD